jgi:histone deacetylase 1/2
MHIKPNYEFLYIFECACWPSLRKYNSHRLEFHSKMCVFLGYSTMHNGYKCLDKSTRRIYISRDVVFDETVFSFATPAVSVDASVLSKAIRFPHDEPVTGEHVRNYDLPYLSTDPPVQGDALPLQMPSPSVGCSLEPVIDVHWRPCKGRRRLACPRCILRPRWPGSFHASPWAASRAHL